jgi:hypothetical protein
MKMDLLPSILLLSPLKPLLFCQNDVTKTTECEQQAMILMMIILRLTIIIIMVFSKKRKRKRRIIMKDADRIDAHITEKDWQKFKKEGTGVSRDATDTKILNYIDEILLL